MGTCMNLNYSYQFYYNFRVCDDFNWVSLPCTFGKQTPEYPYNYSHMHIGTHISFPTSLMSKLQSVYFREGK